MNVIERENYLRGFGFAKYYTKGSKQGIAPLALLMFEKRGLIPAWSPDFTDGFVDGILSALGVDGVCSQDCLCRNDFNSRRYFHQNEKLNQHLLKSIPSGGLFTIEASWYSSNDEQANGRFLRK